MNQTIDFDAEKQAAYQLINIKGVGIQSCIKLVTYAQDAKSALQLSEHEVRDVLPKSSADAFVYGREKMTDTKIKELERKDKFLFVPYTSRKYPEKLKNISNPPFVLYVRGELPEENKPSVAIIGARACSEYGKAVARQFGKQLGAAGIQIISGMAKGIDGIAQQGALDGGGKTYGILGSGVDVIYPPENERLYHSIIGQGGIISEYPPGMEAQSAFFPQRNRIISGLADLLLVVEARKRSGTYITVTQALEQGRDVFVVPGRITDTLSEGCNYLLTQGAGVAVSPECVMEELFRMKDVQIQNKQEPVENLKTPTGKGEKTLRDHIFSVLDITPIALDAIYQTLQMKTRVSMEELLLELTKMQMTGVVAATGNYYRLTCAL